MKINYKLRESLKKLTRLTAIYKEGSKYIYIFSLSFHLSLSLLDNLVNWLTFLP